MNAARESAGTVLDMTTNEDTTDALSHETGEHAAALEGILQRIPDGWGRSISCGPGWHSLLSRLDAELTGIAPDYVLHQVKEKFGTLRYYIDLPGIEPACCTQWDATHPRPYPEPVDPVWARPGRTPQMQEALNTWWAQHEEHTSSDACIAAWQALEPVIEQRRELLQQLHELISRYEEESARTCEECAAPGDLTTSARGRWLKTLCAACAREHGYLTRAEQREKDITEGRLVQLEHTDQWLRCHDAGTCHEQVCSLHARTDHPMRSWPQHWRGDRYLMERTCPHGVGHPDPDDYMVRTGGHDGVHGCDGCCAP